MKRLLFISPVILALSNNSYALNQVPKECYSIETSNKWGSNSSIKITAKCDIDFTSGGQVLFEGQHSGNAWGKFPTNIKNWNGWTAWNSSEKGFNYIPNDYEKKKTHILKTNEIMELEYTSNQAASNVQIFSGVSATDHPIDPPSPPIPSIKSTLVTKFLNSPKNVTEKPSIILSNSLNEIKIDGNWGQSLSTPNIPLSTYQVKVNVVCDDIVNECYEGISSEKSITFSEQKAQAELSVDYKAIPQYPVQVHLKGLDKSIDSFNISFKNANGIQFKRSIKAVENITLNLPAGQYSISIDKIVGTKQGISFEAKNIIPQSLIITGNQSVSLSIEFKKVTEEKPQIASKDFIGYYASWGDIWANPENASTLKLANISKNVNIIAVSFAKPDLTYDPNSENFSSTGMQFSSSKETVKKAIKIAQDKGQKVILAVGGATYNEWNKTNYKGIAQVINDFGFDGVDIDYEKDGGCNFKAGQGGMQELIGCQTDDELTTILKEMRKSLPNKLITVAARSVGAQNISASPYATSGGWYNPIKNAGKGNVDIINIMSYDVNGSQQNPSSYKPIKEAENFRKIFDGKVTIGIEVGLSIDGKQQDDKYIKEMSCFSYNHKSDSKYGMMLWTVDESTPNHGGLDYKKIIEIIGKVKNNPAAECN